MRDDERLPRFGAHQARGIDDEARQHGARRVVTALLLRVADTEVREDGLTTAPGAVGFVPPKKRVEVAIFLAVLATRDPVGWPLPHTVLNEHVDERQRVAPLLERALDERILRSDERLPMVDLELHAIHARPRSLELELSRQVRDRMGDGTPRSVDERDVKTLEGRAALRVARDSCFDHLCREGSRAEEEERDAETNGSPGVEETHIREDRVGRKGATRPRGRSSG